MGHQENSDTEVMQTAENSPEPKKQEEKVAENGTAAAQDGVEDETVLTPEKEMELIKKAEQRRMKVGDTFYLVEMPWLKTWRTYIKEDASDSSERERPGKINNGILLDADGTLKRNVHERWDFELINEDCWNLFMQWYGGGPPIPRKVIPSRNDWQPTIELRPLLLKVVRSTDLQNPHVVYYSRADTVGKLKEDMKEKFNLDPADFRLWDYHAGRKIKHLTVMNEKLEDAQIIDQQLVLIEEKTNGQFPPDTSGYGYSSSRPPAHPGLVGLGNLGNTCFMNSALQCLSNTTPLSNFFLSEDFMKDLNKDNPLGSGGELAEEFHKLLKEIWTGNSNVTAPREFKYKLEKFAPQFSGYNQHDSQELLAFLLDGLHEDLNRIKKKPYVPTFEANGRPDAEVADEAWKGHKSRNDSFVVDYFQDQLKSTLVCPDCGKVSVTFDPFMYLSLPLPISKARLLCLTLVFLDPHRLPLKLVVKTNKYGFISELKADISTTLEGVISPENIVLTDVYSCRFFKDFKDKDAIEMINARDDIVGYELKRPSAADGELVYLSLLNRKEERIPMSSLPGQVTHTVKSNFGIPHVISLPKVSTGRSIYELVEERLQRFIKKDVPTPEDADEKESEQNSDQDQELEDSQEDKPKEASASPKKKHPSHPYFEVRVLRKISYTEEESIIYPDDENVELEDRLTLIVFWKPWAHKNVYNEEAEKQYEEHPSLAAESEPEDNTLSLTRCIELFTTKEQLGPDDLWYCSQCKEHRQAFKKFDLWRVPPILIIHLKRFSYKNKYWREKIETLVKFPLSDLNLSEYISCPDVPVQPIYDLYAVSNHYGSLGGGHYTAYAKNGCTNQWYKFDDSSVSEVSSEESVITPAAYILFYKRKDVSHLFNPAVSNNASSSSSSSSSSTTTSTSTNTSAPSVASPAPAMEVGSPHQLSSSDESSQMVVDHSATNSQSSSLSSSTNIEESAPPAYSDVVARDA